MDKEQPTPVQVPIRDEQNAEIDPWLLDLLVCPIDHAQLRHEPGMLVCAACGRAYPIRSGIPVMIPEDASIEQKF